MAFYNVGNIYFIHRNTRDFYFFVKKIQKNVQLQQDLINVLILTYLRSRPSFSMHEGRREVFCSKEKQNPPRESKTIARHDLPQSNFVARTE